MQAHRYKRHGNCDGHPDPGGRRLGAYAAYDSCAGLLGESEAQNRLQRTLNEEKETDEKLTELSEEINIDAMGGASGKTKMQDEADDEVSRPRGKSRSAKA